MVRDFHDQFPGICRNLTSAVLGVGSAVIANERRRARAGASEPPENGLVQHIRANPRPMTPVQESLRSFFDIYLAGSPTSESGLANIHSAIPVKGKRGLYKILKSTDASLLQHVHVESRDIFSQEKF